jgi:branched-chain amino acid aminotransferase
VPLRILVDDQLAGPDDARIPVLDRGFLYGDSIYEVVRTYGGKPFALGPHLARLERSAEAIALPLPSRTAIVEGLRRTIDAAVGGTADEAYARVIVTRGAGEIGLDPALAEGGPRLIVIAKPLTRPAPEVYASGVAVAIVGVRRNLRRALDPRIKSGNYLNNVLALAEARKSGAYEALMLDAEGFMTEGSSCNFFFVVDGRLCTPSLEVGILEGVTRGTVIALARTAGVAVDEGRLLPTLVPHASEAFLTSTLRGVLPVTRIDGAPVGDGAPGPLTRRLGDLYEAEASSHAAY